MTPEVDTVVTERPQQFRYTTAIPTATKKNARLARRSFEAFRRTIRPEMIWNPFVLRLTRELERFGLAYGAGKRPKLILSTPPQVGKSMAAEDFAAWMIGRQPDWRTIYASYSEGLGTRINLNLQRTAMSRRYREVFPSIVIGASGWMADTTMIEFAGFNGSFRSTTIEGPITGFGLNLGIVDDYAKGRAEANSKQSRDKTWQWFTDDFLTRFAKDSAFLCIATRWHIADLFGQLKKKWPELRSLNFPALAEKDEGWRNKGDPLFPEHRPLEMWRGEQSMRTPIHPKRHQTLRLK
jgi:Terminase large subunit, T4likevirus-type, N-terminal